MFTYDKPITGDGWVCEYASGIWFAGYLASVWKSRSLSTETTASAGTNNWQDRIAELRLRTPSPSPRKVTNYPEAPPSIFISKFKLDDGDVIFNNPFACDLTQKVTVNIIKTMISISIQKVCFLVLFFSILSNELILEFVSYFLTENFDIIFGYRHLTCDYIIASELTLTRRI